MKKISVAAIQVTSNNGQLEQNLRRTEGLVADAASRGAELVICPEFLGTGYRYDASIWQSGEPTGGPTERWLERLAARHGVTLGAGYLEADGEHFFNTFTIFGPDGELCGRVRKRSLPFFEGWYFKPCDGPKVVQTRQGRLAVGICNDCQTADFLRHLCEARPDLIVMPHSAPTPLMPLAGVLFRREYTRQLRGIAGCYARALGVPVVMANKVSRQREWAPIPLAPGLRIPWRFEGYSSIHDCAGQQLTELVDAEGALVAEVNLDPDARRQPEPPRRGYFSFSPGLAGAAMGPLLDGLAWLGQRAYDRSDRRRAEAQRISGSKV